MSQEEHWPVRELQASIINSNLGKPSIKKTIFLLTFVNKDFTPPPPNYWQKTIEVRGSGQGGDPPLYKSEK